jgi:DNA polymerase
VLHAHVDIETSSELDLKKVGVDAYARHASTRILMLSWRIGAGEVNTWTIEDGPLPRALLLLLQDPTILKFAHNAYFEVTLIAHVWWMWDLDITQWRCTMVWAYMLSLPGSLDQLGDVLLLPKEMRKGKDGMRLMKLFSMPQKLTKKNPHRWHSAATRPTEWAQFVEYNRQDVVAESFIAEKRLAPYPIPDEQWADWFVDHRINERGLPIDRQLVDHACRMVTLEVEQLRVQLKELTGADNPNSDAQFGPWIRARGYPFGDLQKASVQKILEDELYADIHEPLRLRAQLKLTSVAKYFAVQEALTADDRLRHTYGFSAAQRTGRWAGRGPHFHNVKKAPKELEPYYADIVASARVGDSRYLRELYGSPLKALSAGVRGMVRAPEGFTLKVADLASIESRVIARLARCPAMLQLIEDDLDI